MFNWMLCWYLGLNFLFSLLDTNILFKDLLKTWSFGKYIYEVVYSQRCFEDSTKTTQQQPPTQVFFLLPFLRMWSPFPNSFPQSGAVSWRLECLLGCVLILIEPGRTALRWNCFFMINWFLGKPFIVLPVWGWCQVEERKWNRVGERQSRREENGLSAGAGRSRIARQDSVKSGITLVMAQSKWV